MMKASHFSQVVLGVFKSILWIRIGRIRIMLVTRIRIRIRIRINKNTDTDPHQSDKLDPEPDPDPHQFANEKLKCMEYEPI
jgi:hypothetical protein